MRNMSFFMTRAQLTDGSKTVTRRLGWHELKPGDRFAAVEKVQGLKAGEKVRRLAVLEATDVRRERLDAIDAGDVAREGFPELSPAEFVAMFCKALRCEPATMVTRIEFRQVLEPEEA